MGVDLIMRVVKNEDLTNSLDDDSGDGSDSFL